MSSWYTTFEEVVLFGKEQFFLLPGETFEYCGSEAVLKAPLSKIFGRMSRQSLEPGRKYSENRIYPQDASADIKQTAIAQSSERTEYYDQEAFSISIVLLVRRE